MKTVIKYLDRDSSNEEFVNETTINCEFECRIEGGIINYTVGGGIFLQIPVSSFISCILEE